MTRDADDARESALHWIVRTNDPAFEAWEEFTDWLEKSPANAEAYHRLAGSEADLCPIVAAITMPNGAGEAHAERGGRRGLAVAAGIAALAGVMTAIVAPRLMPLDYSTAPGETRTIALGDEDQLIMNGDTRLSLSGFGRRTVKLEQGQLLLHLRESGKGPVEVRAGDLTVVDVGTVFEVVRNGKSTSVAVSEGAVLADPNGAQLKLSPGERLDTVDGADVLQAAPVDPAAVGAFARGQLIYADQPIEQVAADLRRSTGIDFSTTPAIRARRFNGTLSVAEVKRDPKSLEPLLGVSLKRSGRGWVMGGKG
ncbi:FecR domain-containing protein [Sphingomonas sp. G124]|uniref:FecR domain-containing protein n=1 Tax=Sphingomonas cremea TaxID=2904799 RepID=A0A9X1QQ31_9SPHN|nr:FecR domain-containing protein [Sphingomonas cremea]MCF2515928.1 FecR domain-containing protein [Sphingomonas cremea]